MCKPIACTMSRVKPTGQYGFEVCRMCRCRFALGKKCTTLVSDVDNGRGCACVGIGGRREISSSQFCCKPKTARKDQGLLKRKEKKRKEKKRKEKKRKEKKRKEKKRKEKKKERERECFINHSASCKHKTTVFTLRVGFDKIFCGSGIED